MSAKLEGDLRTCLCGLNRCWLTRQFSDANVVADLGGSWRILLLDKHFSICVRQGRRVGGLCDGVAVYPHGPNDRIKLLELKQSLADLPAAKRQLRKGGELVEQALPGGFAGVTVEAEVHVRRAPRSTIKLQDSVKIGRHRVPIHGYRDGNRV